MFSVIMAAYNASKYLDEAVESVLKQTYPQFELLILDDGSTDATLKIARRYEAQDERVRVIAKPSNSGISDTTNIGLREARYEWIAILDSDDIAMPQRLEKQAAAIAAQPQVIAWSGYGHYINEQGRLLYVSDLGPTTEAEFRALQANHKPAMFIHTAFTYRKDLALAVGGYNGSLSGALDLDFMDRLSDYGVMLTLPEVLVQYRVYGGSTTFQKFALQEHEIRYIFERRAAAGTDEAPLTWDDYEARAQRRTELERIAVQLQTRGRMRWYQAGLAMGERNLAGVAGNLAMALVCSPRFTAGKLIGQMRRRLA